MGKETGPSGYMIFFSLEPTISALIPVCFVSSFLRSATQPLLGTFNLYCAKEERCAMISLMQHEILLDIHELMARIYGVGYIPRSNSPLKLNPQLQHSPSQQKSLPQSRTCWIASPVCASSWCSAGISVTLMLLVSLGSGSERYVKGSNTRFVCIGVDIALWQSSNSWHYWEEISSNSVGTGISAFDHWYIKLRNLSKYAFRGYKWSYWSKYHISCFLGCS